MCIFCSHLFQDFETSIGELYHVTQGSTNSWIGKGRLIATVIYIYIYIQGPWGGWFDFYKTSRGVKQLPRPKIQKYKNCKHENDPNSSPMMFIFPMAKNREILYDTWGTFFYPNNPPQQM